MAEDVRTPVGGPSSELVPHEDLRDYLPAIEPERQVSDWGRSERVEGLIDRTVVDFLYHLWFRCEVEGIENVPAAGAALLVSNHSGALPPDAAMIVKAVKEEHPRPRPVHLTVEHFFKGYPGFSMLIPKIGGVAAHPANVHRLLFDERQLVLVFPEGRKGTEKLYRDRYRLRRLPIMSKSSAWIAARTSWATVWTSALSSHGSSPMSSVRTGGRKRILNLAGR